MTDEPRDNARDPEPSAGAGADELGSTQEFSIAEDLERTQLLQPAGHTDNLYLAGDETVVLSDGARDTGSLHIGRHSVVTEEDITEFSFMPSTLGPDAPASPAASETPGDFADRVPAPRRSRGLRVFLVVLAVLVVCALAGVAAWLVYDHQRTEELLEPHPVYLSIDAPGYDVADSKIPFLIEGTDATGRQVSTVGFVGPDGAGIQLPCGRYVIRVAASPLLDDAQFYIIPELPADLVIPDDLEEGAPVELATPKFEFMFADVVDISDEQLDAAYDYALESGFGQSRADEYWTELSKKRDAALAVVRAAEEKQTRIKDATSALEAKAKERGVNGVASLLVDLDGDEIPELLLAGNSASPLGAMCLVYGYDALSHQVLELCSAAGGANHSPGIWYSPAKHEVAFATSGPNTETYAFYTVAPESATLEYTYSHTWGLDPEAPENQGRTELFTLDATPISQASFADAVNGLARFYHLASPAN